MKENGLLKDEELKITESAVRDIIRHYTRESGVRNLEREIVEDLPQSGQIAAAEAA